MKASCVTKPNCTSLARQLLSSQDCVAQQGRGHCDGQSTPSATGSGSPPCYPPFQKESRGKESPPVSQHCPRSKWWQPSIITQVNQPQVSKGHQRATYVFGHQPTGVAAKQVAFADPRATDAFLCPWAGVTFLQPQPGSQGNRCEGVLLSCRRPLSPTKRHLGHPANIRLHQLSQGSRRLPACLAHSLSKRCPQEHVPPNSSGSAYQASLQKAETQSECQWSPIPTRRGRQL